VVERRQLVVVVVEHRLVVVVVVGMEQVVWWLELGFGVDVVVVQVVRPGRIQSNIID
jgi:hypothetical protein